MKQLSEYLMEAVSSGMEENINSFVQSWLKHNKYNLDFNFKELFKIYKAVNSSFRKQDIIDAWDFVTDPQEKTEPTMHRLFDVLDSHPDWTLREMVAHWETTDTRGVTNEYQFKFILDKINKKLG